MYMPIRTVCFLDSNVLEAGAVLNKCVIAPRKMRIVANIIRNKPVSIAYSLLENINKTCTPLFIKLLKSAVSNFELKCDKLKEKFYNIDSLYISKICVDSAGMLKRVLPAPQGRALRKRRRLSNVLIIVKPLVSKEKDHIILDNSDVALNGNVKSNKNIKKTTLKKTKTESGGQKTV